MRRALTLATLLAAWTTPVTAQLISIRTVPVSQSHQFDILPSTTRAMGGISIAAPDSLLDPFVNPAKGARIGLGHYFGSPGVYSVSSRAGAGRSLPVGALASLGSWFGAVSFALQEVDLSNEFNVGPISLSTCPECESAGLETGTAERSHGNEYAYMMIGRELGGTGLSLAGSVTWYGLSAVDGVDLLYAGSSRIKQYGHSLDLRVGVLKEWQDNRTFEAMLLHNRFRMTHDVFYLDNFWDPGRQQFAQQPRFEGNLDRTSTWGLHLEYEQPLSSGWRVGWLATANQKSHPKIPNYEIMNIPRDPGHSSAFNLGLGLARQRGATTTFGIDIIYEPIWSYTWADSEDPLPTSNGGVIEPGGKTIENRFRFSNAGLRMGIGDEVTMKGSSSAIGFQLGLGVQSIHYWLDQTDNVQLSSRSLEEQWFEWSPTWGLSFRFTDLEVRYRGSTTHGTGRPGVRGNGGDLVLASAAESAGSNILVAPSGPLTLTDVAVVTHQISFSLPLR
jgi:hypothetical protein